MANTENSTSFNSTASVSSPCPLYTQNVWIVALQIVDWTLSLPSVSWALWLLIRGSHTSLEAELSNLNLICMDTASFLVTLGSFLNANLLHSRILDICGEYWYLLCLFGHPLFQCCVCFERYLAVVHPITFLKYRPMRYKLIALFFLWQVTLVSTIAQHFSYTPYILLANLLPVVCTESFCSLSILRVLKNKGPGDELKRNGRDREANNLIKKRAFIIVVILQIKLLINYLPFIIITLIKDIFPLAFYNCYLFSTTLSICFFGNFFQSFLYLQRTGRLSFIPGF